MVDERYLWAQVYFLFRCGYIDKASELLNSHQNSLKRGDHGFPGALKTYATSRDRRLPKIQKDQLYNDYNSNVRSNSSVDQFKHALYKLVGRFELSHKVAKVATTTEDWIWLQLCLVRESKDDGPQQSYAMGELGELVLKYGNEKFDANGSKPFAWFNLLLLAGQYERVSMTSDTRGYANMSLGHRLSVLQAHSADRCRTLRHCPPVLWTFARRSA